VIALDQYTKMWASNELVYRVPVEITAWFDLMLAHNTGAAFSFLASAGGWQRWFLAAVACVSVVCGGMADTSGASAAVFGRIARTHIGWWSWQSNRSSDT
jgi:lipoprotein signal peptidase